MAGGQPRRRRRSGPRAGEADHGGRGGRGVRRIVVARRGVVRRAGGDGARQASACGHRLEPLRGGHRQGRSVPGGQARRRGRRRVRGVMLRLPRLPDAPQPEPDHHRQREEGREAGRKVRARADRRGYLRLLHDARVEGRRLRLTRHSRRDGAVPQALRLQDRPQLHGRQGRRDSRGLRPEGPPGPHGRDREADGPRVRQRPTPDGFAHTGPRAQGPGMGPLREDTGDRVFRRCCEGKEGERQGPRSRAEGRGPNKEERLQGRVRR